jgi:hypothetical protein
MAEEIVVIGPNDHGTCECVEIFSVGDAEALIVPASCA